MSLFFYRLLMLFLAPVIIIVILLRSISQAEYRHRLFERLGFLSCHYNATQVVVHAASVGEVLAIKPFVEQLLAKGLSVTFTTFTPTGSAQVKKIFTDRVQHCYLPLDIWPCTALFLNKINPKALVVMETELWPNLLAQCKKRRIKLLLINARLSDSSMNSYSKIKPLITPALHSFDNILCQSQHNYQNFAQLGASTNKLMVSGNVKFDIAKSQSHNNKAAELKTLIPENKILWVVASTHAGDEEIALNCLPQLAKQIDNLLLVIVPRHPERFDQVAKLVQSRGITYQRRSTNNLIEKNTQVWLIDTLGELMSVYQLADIVTMGGSFSTIGGHNPLEPALYKKPIIVGSDMRNFVEVEQQLLAVNGMIKLAKHDEESQLCHHITQLLELPQHSKTLGDNAYQVVINNQGATSKSVAALIQLIQDNDQPVIV